MNGNRQLFFAAIMSVVIVSSESPAQEEEGDPKSAPIGSVSTYTYSSTGDALKMLEDIVAANEEVLKNQEATLLALDRLGEKANAARVSAASGSRKK
jgi:hypothetical protein